MAIYERAKKALCDQVQRVMDRHHGRLAELSVPVTVDTLIAYVSKDESGNPKSDYAIKVGGVPAYAKIRIVSLKDRVKGHADAELVIDGDRCLVWDTDRMSALIDHELTHLEPQFEAAPEGAASNLKLDDANRPRLKMRLHDRQFGWFDEVASRHGQHSIEVRQFQDMIGGTEFKQLYLVGMEDELSTRRVRTRGKEAAVAS